MLLLGFARGRVRSVLKDLLGFRLQNILPHRIQWDSNGPPFSAWCVR